MIDKIEQYKAEISAYLANSNEEVEAFRIKFLSKKGLVSSLFDEFKTYSGEQKRDIGKPLNELQNFAKAKLEALQSSTQEVKAKTNKEDLTKPAYPKEIGARHPINIVKNKIIDIFSKIGFSLSDGPEIEDDWHNFTALNLPADHPARDMQDTFFLDENKDSMLRTHTSSVQIRYMQNNKPPIRILSPGRVYRNEAISARSHCMFHQIEGLYVDKEVSFADLKQTLQYFTTSLFGKSEIRLRPSYFPFTEPSAEVDVYWGLENEIDKRITKGTGWLEIGGCGMVDPNVLKNANIDPTVYSGFAFGVGIERIAMLLYGIGDIRLFFENDLRFLKQFSSEVD